MHSMTPKPPSRAAFVLLAMNYIQARSGQHHCFFSHSIFFSGNQFPQCISDSRPSPTPRLARWDSLTSSFSPRTTLRSLCPASAHPILLSLNCSALISPVKAPLGLSKTFWLQTSISFFRCSRTRSRKRPGGAMTTSVSGLRGALLRW